MRNLILLTATLSLVITSPCFAAAGVYSASDSDYINGGSTYGNHGVTNVGCRLQLFPHPQKPGAYGRPTEDYDGITIEYDGPYVKSKTDADPDNCNGATSEVPEPPETPAKIVFKQNNKVYAEYNGLVDDGNLYNGRYTFANGEVWSVKGRELTVLTPSPAKTKNKQVQTQKEDGERKIKIQKLTEFRKKLKAGSEVILRLNGSYGKGVVVKTKNDAAEVQVHFLMINGNETPYTKKVWINKRDLAYSRLAFVD